MFKYRSYQSEFLDADYIPQVDLYQNLKELDFINTWLGGHNITIQGLAYFVNSKIRYLLEDYITIADVGCGGGDNLLAIAKWARNQRIRVKLIGIDIKPDCINYAKENCKAFHEISFIESDYQLVDEKFDIIFSALFCHHLNDEQLVHYFKWCDSNSRMGFFVNDLQRNSLAFYSIKYLTKLLSKSYLVKNDAPLSVLRGFRKAELDVYLSKAKVDTFKIMWKWAFRYLVVRRKY
ncbi:MAG: methyltransferase domain-containing protein [Cytophagales bacterium]